MTFFRKIPAHWLVFAAGLLASLWAAQEVRRDIDKDEASRFGHAADHIAFKIRERLESQELILRGGAGLFAASTEVDRRDWRTYVSTLRTEEVVPGTQGIGFAQAILPTELDRHVARVRAEGFPYYTVNPPGQRELYTAIVYLEPFRDRNLRAFGYDMYSEPVRRQAMAAARDQAQAALSGKVELVQETSEEVQAGTLMYYPVYRKDKPLESVEQRRAALVGWTYSPFRMGDLMKSTLRAWENQLGGQVNLSLFDGTGTEPKALLFSTGRELFEHQETPHHQHRIIDFNGKQWLLALDSKAGFQPLFYLPAWLTLLAGLVITILLSRLMQSLHNTRANAEAIAGRLTADLRQKDRLLSESEYRWKFALEGSDLGVWDWNIPESRVYFSKLWKSMLGYEDAEIGTGLDEWSKRVHPDDLDSTMAAVQAYLDGQTPYYDNEHRVQCKDGSYKWIRDRGTVVSRDADGKPLRMIGTHSDVTDRRTLENILRQQRAELEAAQRIAKLGSWSLDLQSGKIMWSQELYHMLGLDPEMPPPNLQDQERLHTPESWSRLNGSLRKLQNSGTPYEIELETVLPDGNHRWMFARGEAVRDSEGRIHGARGIALDITERKRGEESLIASRELLHSIVEHAPVRIFWKDAQLRYLGCNSAFAQDAGLSSVDEVIGKDDYQLVWREHAEQYRADDRQVMDSGLPKIAFEEPVTTADGGQAWLRTSKVPLRDKDGQVFGMLGVYENITDEKQAALNIRRLTNLYAALSETNSAVIRSGKREDLFRRVCEVVVDLGGLDMAWIGITDAEGRVAPVASHGIGLEYLDGILVTIHADDSHGRGPTGTAVRESRAIWVDDYRSSPYTTPWQKKGAPYGWQSSAALPICEAGRPVGALTFYSRETGGWQSPQTRDLLEKIAAAINLALDRFATSAEAEATRLTLTESEQRFRTMIEQSVAGAFIIQDNAFVYVNPRFERILGYPVGDGLVGRPPLAIVAGKDRKLAEAQLRSLAEGQVRNADLAFTALRKDGSEVEVGISYAGALYQHRPAIIGLMQDISDRKVVEDQVKRYAKQLEYAFMQMVALATTLSEMRDAYTAGHEKRVAEIAVAIGAEMGLDSQRLEGLRVAGYLHDVGKVSIPTEILSKPGRLNPLEMELIKTHPRAGYDVLKDIEFPWPVAQVALQHHERIDGSGYPAGLKGDEIMLEARITAVADVVESMASHRPYRAALGIDKALAEIERGAGTIYDPEVAAACLRLYRDQQHPLPA